MHGLWFTLIFYKIITKEIGQLGQDPRLTIEFEKTAARTRPSQTKRRDCGLPHGKSYTTLEETSLREIIILFFPIFFVFSPIIFDC